MDTSLTSETRLGAFKEWLPKVNEIRNLTPHNVKIDSGDVGVTYECEQESLRISETFEKIGDYAGNDIVNKKMGKLELPDFEQGVLNIVSLPVAQMIARDYPRRLDFVTVGELIRDKDGNITGCKNLAFIE